MCVDVLVNGPADVRFWDRTSVPGVMFVSLSGRVTNRLGRSKVALATVVALAAVLGGVAPVAFRALEVTAGAPASLTGVPVKVDTPGKAAPAKVVNQATRTYKAAAARPPRGEGGAAPRAGVGLPARRPPSLVPRWGCSRPQAQARAPPRTRP